MGYEIYYRRTKSGDRYDVYSTIIMKYIKRGLKSPEEVVNFVLKYTRLPSSENLEEIRQIWIKAAKRAKEEENERR